MIRSMISAEAVPDAMRDLVAWVNSEKAARLHPLKRAAIFYARYDAIHPFTGATKHAARFFASKIMLLGQNGIYYPPLMDDLGLFWLGPVITERPDPFTRMGGVAFGGGDGLFGQI
jgi:hypothetical protein